MNKPKAQGTRWESQVTEQFRLQDIPAGRYPEGGTHDLGDVWVGQPFLPGDPPPIVALAWKRLIPKPGSSRRVPDGDATVVVIDLGDFIELVAAAELPHLAIECKATQTLNVTRTLHAARQKIYGASQ